MMCGRDLEVTNGMRREEVAVDVYEKTVGEWNGEVHSG